MLPHVIIHSTISLDGSIKNFDCNIPLHYKIAARYKADAHLVGSVTARDGILMFNENVPHEEERDFHKNPAEENNGRIICAMADSKGILKGMLHVYRRFEFCREVVVIVSETTPQEYLDYLKERNYDYIVAGKNRINFTQAINKLHDDFGVKTLISDSGGILSSLLLNLNMVNRLSIIVAPELVCREPSRLFAGIDADRDNIQLKLEDCEKLDEKHALLTYRVLS